MTRKVSPRSGMPGPAAGVLWLWRTLVLLLVLLYRPGVDANDGNPEVKSLSSIKQALHDPENVLASWDPNYLSPCTFAFVECDDNNSVSGLELPPHGLSGSLSPLIGSFSNLQRLIVTNNSISGLLPSEIGNLSKLVVLDLSRNAFNGVIHEAIVNLTSLVILNLGGNHFNGSFPFFVANMSSLQSLDISQLGGSCAQDSDIENFDSGW